MAQRHPALYALLPPLTELAGFNLTSVYTTEDFKLLLGIRRNIALRELAAALMERLGVQPSPGSQTYVACPRRPRARSQLSTAANSTRCVRPALLRRRTA